MLVDAKSLLLALLVPVVCIAGGYDAKSSKKDTQALGGFGQSKNAAIKIPEGMKQKGPWVYLQVAFRDDGATVYLCNPTEEDVWFPALDSRLFLTREIKLPSDGWQQSDGDPTSFCGNSRHRVCLKPGEAWKFDTADQKLGVPVRYKVKTAIKTVVYSPVYQPNQTR